MKDKSDYDCPICHKQSLLRIGIPPTPIVEEMPKVQHVKIYYIYCMILLGTLAGVGIYYAIARP